MMMHTHVAFAALCALIAETVLPTGNTILFFLIAIAASFIPDLDHPQSWINNKLRFTKVICGFVEHRGIFHSGLFGVTLGAAMYLLISPTYTWALLVGFFSHVLIDGFTKQGVNLLHPLSELHLRGPIITNTISEHVLLGIIITLITLRLF